MVHLYVMLPATLTLGIQLVLHMRKVECVTFQQSKPQIVKEGTTELQITCSHDDSDLNVMLWYQQRVRSMTLIGYGYVHTSPSYEGQFEQQFKITRQDIMKGALIVRSVDQSHSAVYFCAAKVGWAHHVPAYFGGGTKLTVLETGRTPTPPNVTLLPPSDKECTDNNNIAKKTLVCVATGFYPDHVNVSWERSGIPVTEAVATDSAALRNGEDYSITSRLRVKAREWYTPEMNFTCIVRFFNGASSTLHKSPTIRGVEGQTMKIDTYMQSTQVAKLSYMILIAKSIFFGLVLIFVLHKVQGSAEKLQK